MNLFRLLGMLHRGSYHIVLAHFLSCKGDLAHLASIFILLHKIQTTRSCRGAFFSLLSFALWLIIHPTPARHIIQNASTLRWNIRCTLPRSLLALCFSLQLVHESFLHW